MVPVVVAEATVRAYQRTARIIVRDDSHPYRERLLALIDLAAKARSEPVLSRWSVEAVWREAAGFLGEPLPRDYPDPPLSDPVEQACRRQTAKGRIQCEYCLRPLPTEQDYRRWRRMRLLAAEELEGRERPIPEHDEGAA